MWYFMWFLGTIVACAFGIIAALAFECIETSIYCKKNTNEKHNNG